MIALLHKAVFVLRTIRALSLRRSCKLLFGKDSIMCDVTAIILTKNEASNIGLCIQSIKGFAKRVVVIDSGSDDETVDIANSLGAEVFFHPFENYSKQFNWGIDNTGITTKWILRLDADERFTPALCSELSKEMTEHDADDINGFVLEADLYFLNKRIKFGGSHKKKLMVFKTGIGRIEERKMDEHTILSCGFAKEIKSRFLHYDFKDLTTYVKKLNWYATREMQDYFEDRFGSNEKFNASSKEIISTRKKKSTYYKFPPFFRCWLNYFYNLIFKGYLFSGRQGMMYAFLYHFYYRWLVDAKIYEQKQNQKPFEETGDLK